MSKTPPSLDHPELLVIKSTSTVQTTSSANSSASVSKAEIAMKSLKHPAMIPPSIQEENVSDLYEIMPEIMHVPVNRKLKNSGLAITL